jgi:hypothetical protein
MPLNINDNIINSDIVKTFSYRNIITRGMTVHLDAGVNESYPGSGTVWYDLSGNSNHFNIVSGAYNSSGAKYMDFNGSYGMAKSATDVSLSNNVTYILWTRIKNSSADWRTLTRGYASDHQVIIQTGAWEIGYYDSSTTFVGSGYSQQSLPNYGTSNWICLYFRYQTSSPYFTMAYNDTPETIRASITNSNAGYTNGFGSLGGYHAGSTEPSVGNQFWGDIASFMTYNRVLSDSELLQVYNAQKSRFGY